MKKSIELAIGAKNQTSSAIGAANRDFKDLSEQYDQTRSAQAKLSKQLKDVASYTKQSQAHKKLSIELERDKKNLKAVKAQFEKLENPTVKQAKAYHNLAAKVELSEGKLATQKTVLSSMNNALRKGGVNIDKLADEEARLARLTSKTTEKLKQQNNQLKQLKQNSKASGLSNIASIGGGALASVGVSNKAKQSILKSVENEASFAEVQKVTSFTKSQQENLKDWSLRLSTSDEGGGLSSNQINSILASGGRTGIKDLEKLKAFTLNSIKMATAFDIEAGEAGSTLAKWKTAMRLDSKQAYKLAGLTNYLSNNANSTAAAIAEVLARQGASAKQSGFKVHEAAALSSTLLSNGMTPETAATALKNISGRLTKGSSATNAQKEAFDHIGLDPVQLAKAMQLDAPKALTDVLQRISRLDAHERGSVTSEIFGEESKGAVSALSGNLKELSRQLALSKQDSSVHIKSINDEFAAKTKLTKNTLDKFSNSIDRLQVVIGDSWLSSVNKITNLGSGTLNSISSIADKHETGTQVASGAAAAGSVYASYKLSEQLFNRFNKKPNMMKLASKAFRPVATIASGLSIASSLHKEDYKGTSKQIGGLTGGLGGAFAVGAAGAAIGSAVPVLGTIVGGAIGAAVGSLGGDILGSKIGSIIADQLPSVEKAVQERQVNNKTVNYAVTYNVQGIDKDGIKKELVKIVEKDKVHVQELISVHDS